MTRAIGSQRSLVLQVAGRIANFICSPGDRMVESAQTVEQLDADSRIVRTAYRLGWPSRCAIAPTASRRRARTNWPLGSSLIQPSRHHHNLQNLL